MYSHFALFLPVNFAGLLATFQTLSSAKKPIDTNQSIELAHKNNTGMFVA
jgi:hypothetical protein